MWDGMSVTASVTSGGGTGKMFFANQAAVEEVVMATGGMDAETGFGAIAMNYIPREGGNAFSFYGIATGANENMQALNWNESLGARGLDESQVQGLKKNWDWGAGFGGPTRATACASSGRSGTADHNASLDYDYSDIRVRPARRLDLLERLPIHARRATVGLRQCIRMLFGYTRCRDGASANGISRYGPARSRVPIGA